MKHSRSIGILLLLFFSWKISAQITGRPPAQVVPDFQFFRLNNTPFTDRDLPKGKIIFFMFIDPDCDHCQHAMQSIAEQYQAFKRTAFFLVSMFGADKINLFMNTYGSKLRDQKNVTILQDKSQQFITKFNPVRYPSMLLYSPEKKLLDYEDNPESVFRLVNTINKNVK